MKYELFIDAGIGDLVSWKIEETWYKGEVVGLFGFQYLIAGVGIQFYLPKIGAYKELL